MPLKDHYRTLGVSSTASSQEVKKAFRALAHKYHPDKQGTVEDAFATTHFKEIQEAYSILSDSRRRKLYDEERYFSGLSSHKEPAVISAPWILQQAKKLSSHMERVDSYRMNHKALHDYVLLLLSDSHLAVLLHENDAEVNRQIVKEILASIRNLEYTFFRDIAPLLSKIAGTDNEIHQLTYRADTVRRREAKQQKLLPLITLIISLLLCLLMYLYARSIL
jgi:hypothetical protein